MFLVTSPIVINVPTRGLLAVETMHAIVRWLANLNIKRNMMSMFVNKKHRYTPNQFFFCFVLFFFVSGCLQFGEEFFKFTSCKALSILFCSLIVNRIAGLSSPRVLMYSTLKIPLFWHFTSMKSSHQNSFLKISFIFHHTIEKT